MSKYETLFKFHFITKSHSLNFKFHLLLIFKNKNRHFLKFCRHFISIYALFFNDMFYFCNILYFLIHSYPYIILKFRGLYKGIFLFFMKFFKKKRIFLYLLLHFIDKTGGILRKPLETYISFQFF